MGQHTKSILEMARGAFIERADYEMKRALDNILDPNTKATAKRKIAINISLTPDDNRKNIAVSVETKSNLAPTTPTTTSLYVIGGDSSGTPQVVEMTPQIPGQLDFFGEEQEEPCVLRVIPLTECAY